MKIVCPQCGFSRELPPDRLPSRAVIATCPECGCRFRFSADKGVLETLSPLALKPEAAAPRAGRAAPAMHGATEHDDPLPPGAIVPGRDRNAAAGPLSPDGIAAEAGQPERDDQAGVKVRDRNAAAAHEEEEDIRLAASRAYAREAARLRSGADPAPRDAAEGIPWDAAPGEEGWPAAFYRTVMRVMFDAPRFFSMLNPGAHVLRSLAFYLIVAVIQIVGVRIWGGILQTLMAPSAATDPQLGKILAMLAPQTNLAITLLYSTAELTLRLYIFSAIIHLTCRWIAPQRSSFALIFQVLAYASAPGLLYIVPLLGPVAGMIWNVACVVVGLRAALNLTWPQTLLSLAPLALLLLLIGPLFLQLMAAAQV